jgi:DNA transformation protein
MAARKPSLPGDPFVRQVLFSLEPVLPVTARAMFGGWGIYHDGKIFGLIAGSTFYLKADAENRPHFEAAGLGPFTYDGRDGKPVAMSYYEVPNGLLGDPPGHRDWLDGALAAAKRASASKNRKAAGTR